jgi:hypothetical protein
MISNDSVNTLLIAGRKFADELDLRGKHAEAIAVIQLTSKQALSEMKHLPKAVKVQCRCGKILRNGREVEFYNNVGSCYDCDSSYIDSLDL